MKKLSILLILFLVFAFGFAHQIAAEEMPEKPESISFVASSEWADPVQSSVNHWAEEKGIAIEWRVLPYDNIFEQQTAAIAGGTPMDVVFVSNSWHAELGEGGMIKPLDAIIEEDFLRENYPASTIELMSSHGHLWGLPLNAGIAYFFYNEEMLSELGYENPPETWGELEEISIEAMEAGLAEHGLFLGLAPLEGLMVYYDVFLKLFDGEWMNEERTEFTFNSEAGVEALTYMRSLIEKGIVPEASLTTPDRDSMHTFLAGNAPFHFNWGFTWGMMQDEEVSTVADVVKSALVPGVENKPRRSYTTMGGGGWGIGATSENPEWALEAIKVATTGQSAVNFIDTRGSDSAYLPIHEDEDYLDEYPLFATYVEQQEYAGFRPSDFLTWYSEFRDDIFLPEIHEALAGTQEPEEALDAAYERAQELLEEEGI